MAVCCQNLTQGALSSRSMLSVLIGVLFKKFGLILNAPHMLCNARIYASCAILCVLYYSFQTFNVWLGGLLNPEAYITATRQCIAQANSWSLEELVLDVTITDGGPDANKPSLDDCSFGVVGKFSDC
jgi:uncharacterized membrane protein YeiH